MMAIYNNVDCSILEIISLIPVDISPYVYVILYKVMLPEII